MKRIWAYAFEIGIVMMGILLVINLLFPTFLSVGIYSCMLILFLVSVLLLKLSNICLLYTSFCIAHDLCCLKRAGSRLSLMLLLADTPGDPGHKS